MLKGLHSIMGRCGSIERRYVEQRKQFDAQATYDAVCVYDEKRAAGLLTSLDLPPDRSRFTMEPRPINDPEFEVFWAAYDMNVGREAAHKAWKRLHPSDREKARKVAALYARANPDKRYRKTPAGWLVNRGWEDEIIDRSTRQATELLDDYMAKPPAVQFYTGDFLTGTTLMSNAEVGLYIRLLCLQAEHGSIPDDVERIVGAFGETCRVIWPVVRRKFVGGPEAGTLVNERMASVMEARDAFLERQREKSAKGVAARHRAAQPMGQPAGLSTDEPVVNPTGEGERDIEKGGTGERVHPTKKTLFVHSRFCDIDIARSALPELVAKGIDIEGYRDRIRDWSDTKDERRTERGWLATYRSWAAADERKGTLLKVKPASGQPRATGWKEAKPAA